VHVLGTLLSVVAVALLLLPDPLIALTDAAPEVEDKVRSYLRIIALGVPAQLAFRVFYSLTTAVSRPRVIMLLNLAGLALKVPLNLVFMHGYLGAPALGGPGCAVSTTVTSWLIVTVAWLVCRYDGAYWPYRIFSRWSWPRWEEQKRLLQIGLPIGFNFLVDVTSFTFMALFIARLGTANSGGHQVAANLASLLYMLPLAMASATVVLTGQAVGAGDLPRARRTGLVGIGGGLVCACAVGMAVWLVRDRIAVLYSSDEEVQAIAAALLAYVAAYHVFDAVSAIAVSALRGYQKTVVPMLCNVGALWVVGLGGGYLLAFGPEWRMGAAGFWIGGIAGLLTGAILIVLYFFRISRPE
jgi:MATE family multidrug resistance protein